TGTEFEIDRLEVTATGLSRRVVVEQSKMDLLVLPLFDDLSGYSQAVFTVPLDPIVPFIDGQRLSITLVFSVPAATETYRIESSFIAERSEHIVYRIDELLASSFPYWRRSLPSSSEAFSLDSRTFLDR
ncbi:MAG: hypothetical protein AAGI44_13500, partial [Pseudomonadota bacterium]